MPRQLTPAAPSRANGLIRFESTVPGATLHAHEMDSHQSHIDYEAFVVRGQVFFAGDADLADFTLIERDRRFRRKEEDQNTRVGCQLPSNSSGNAPVGRCLSGTRSTFRTPSPR